MAKRQRCEDPAWWSPLRDLVVSSGGFVLPSLQFLEANRTLTVKNKVLKGEVVIRIPTKNLMTKDRALSMCHPWLEYIISTEGTTIRWKNSIADLAISVALASCSAPDSYLYTQSLPESTSFDALPRRWSENDVLNLLSGTSVLRHVLLAKSGAAKDYELLLERYHKYQSNRNESSNTSPFPLFERFSDMLAAVTSRAFQIGSTNEDIAMVPILDLGNHTRGTSTNKLGKKNVSYRYDVSEESMIVTSTTDIDIGESIRLTYGAKSNAQLLLNYGFCIPRNLEPDGSSNDVLEFRLLSSFDSINGSDSCVRSSGKSFSLRAGPKSYSYGGFVATLEEYLRTMLVGKGKQKDDMNHDLFEVKEKDLNHNDFDKFLSQFENEDESGEDFGDLYGGKNPELNLASKDRLNTDMKHQDEMKALWQFKLDLLKLSNGYNNFTAMDIATLHLIKPILANAQHYSTLLSISELRTIFFFVRTIEKVQKLLCSQHEEKNNYEYAKLDLVTDQKDFEMIDHQTDNLAKTYMLIRHGSF